MNAMLPIDLPSLFQKEIEATRRPPDGLLHASTDLDSSMRHVMLRAAGAPSKGRSIASDIRLMHGTLWHEWFHGTLIKHGVPFFHELNLTPHMPEGWSGTADWVFWHSEYNAFVLGDLKTAKGESIYWINRDGAKSSHIWQLSAYWHALVNMGLPMVKGFAVMYWPMNDTSDSEVVLPTIQECDPLPADVVLAHMENRWTKTQAYLESLSQVKPQWSDWITDHLAPEQDRIQKVVWNRIQKVFDLRLVPHWSAAFCEWEPPLCECSTRGVTKIGHYTLDGEFIPRRGYEDVHPTVRPSLADYNKRNKEADGSK